VRQENHGRKRETEKLWQKKCGRKITAGNMRQKNRGRKSAAEKSQQQNATRRKMYGCHMCCLELMNLVEGFPCKSVGCSLESLGLVVEWF
jgi:hypothetical protein